ncbi:16S rRNA (cytosine(1402)-N(4))-methyltransferase RsmH [Desertihabitans brevis]|uniref:Ribosomal RNA small subunit methyltransferase H n=1 Tax=Desertihabitans brevis TaxID=2268447 RepID=A0A367YXQ1_9ACTN|nr:16S rRNA (cytosine(1402)-N(4))-methyltransferase RsmH [Desertihabitans brevis]RCK70610.1 16S rRNA (cytosine(1402)-N(4))-methyltransferase RsmH [Desertihabitans brevis]
MSSSNGPGPEDRTHVPVMQRRVLELLTPVLGTEGAVFVDGTLGLAGHTLALLTACPGSRVIGLDRDPEALARAERRLAPVADRVTLVEAVYDELPEVLDRCGQPRVQAVLLDLGLSSLQIDSTERGFAYAVDAPLDMRMDGRQPLTAATVVNTYPAGELARVLRTYGEERFADRIARAIVAEREVAPFTTSARLVETLTRAIPAAARRTGGHPAKRTFQALRIEVNRELAALERVLPAAVDALAVGGRIAVLAYHSLEDRMVKRVLAAASTDTAPPHLPVVPESMRAELRLLTRGAEKADAQEIQENPRSSSVRLRAAERIKEAA